MNEGSEKFAIIFAHCIAVGPTFEVVQQEGVYVYRGRKFDLVDQLEQEIVFKIHCKGDSHSS